MITKRLIEETFPVIGQNGQMNYAKHRKHLVEWIRAQLTGLVTKEGQQLGIRLPGRYIDPEEKHEIIRGVSPTERYPTGVLYPVYRGAEGIDPASEIQEEEGEELAATASTDQPVESAIKRRRYMPPSSVGFSFFVQEERIEFQVLCSAVRYKKKGGEGNSDVARDEEGRFTKDVWERIPLTDSDGEVNTFSSPDCKKNVNSREAVRERVAVFGDRAGIDLLWRPFTGGWITTVSLFNKYELSVEGNPTNLVKLRNENSLFEVELRCVFNVGEVGLYPRVDTSLLTEEEQELELQYKYRHIYAIGHGAAVNWRKKEDDSDSVKEIWAEFFPSVEVPQVTADVADSDNQTLQIAYLASVGATENPVFDDLDHFVAGYADWVEKQESCASSSAVLPDEEEAAKRIVERMGIAVSRMKQGVTLLRKDQRAKLSFALANQAMFDQMIQYDRAQGKAKARDQYRWRPFQLAFLLNVIESVVNEESDFRDTVDLIWFPTGGGKTEAYLGLIAFLIVWRRLTNPASGGGTTVLMRYTLRLLTAQQYLRATRMICALELIRRKRPELGDEPITVGMWVGAATSPNTFKNALQAVDKAADGNGNAPLDLVIVNCPWCGESFNASENYDVSPTNFHFRCTNPNCDFGQTTGGIIPCNVVDEALYADPPTLLIATIDKFARLAWEERTNAFFGKNGNRPPELVVQDELHLIAGALGSVAGLYEAALDTVLVQRGIHPKYIASTATIRMADLQVRRLYGKDVAVFPAPGLSCEDSYFARTVPLNEKSGRLYVGYLAPMLGRQPIGKIPSNIVPLAAALLLAPEVVFADQEDRDALIDAWWTQVVYHGSLKGVGSSHNAFSNDVREYLRRYSEEVNETNKQDSEPKDVLERRTTRIAQLTSLSSAEENARTFACLERSREQPECLDAVLATNMISVGLDVARLALMIVNGQPLTTAEYIQASSRVGRGEVPGVVFANYYRDQARSLSHYENFRPYHESFYRFVEPTSVTPYTYQTRLRALHAALVIAVRHSCNHLLANNKAGSFDPADERIAKVIETLKHRCRQADEGRALETAKHIDKLVYEWKTEVEMCKASKRQLNYQAPDKDKATDRLIHNHDDKIKGRWATLQSMRNVENTALLKPL